MLFVGPGAHGVLCTRPWLIGTPLPWQGSRMISGHISGLCLSPHICRPQVSWDLGLGYGSEQSVSCLEAPLPHSMAQPASCVETLMCFCIYFHFDADRQGSLNALLFEDAVTAHCFAYLPACVSAAVCPVAQAPPR